MIRFLDSDEREQLESLYEAEWGADPPGPRDGVIADLEDDQLNAFITTEAFVRFGMLWLSPEQRDTPEGIRRLLKLFRYLWDNSPGDAAYMIIVDDPRFEAVAKRYGFRPVEGKVYRLDK